MNNKDDIKKLKKLIRAIKSVGPAMPQKADDKYFESLEQRIMDELDSQCSVVKASMVDLIEGTVSEEDAKKIHSHIKSCKDCYNEFKLTEAVLINAKNIDTREESTDNYFGTLPERVSTAVNEGSKVSICETAQEHIVDLLIEEPVTSEIKKHIGLCPDCQKELADTRTIMSAVKNLSVPLPNEQFFAEQLQSIDAKIEELPSHRLAVSEKKEKILSYISGILDTFRVTIMQPQVAIATSAFIALMIIGGRFYHSPESIEEKQINLSEVLNRSTIVAARPFTTAKHRYTGDSISHPDEDSKLEIHSTGTAKAAEKKKTEKKLN